jgi:hypothetical protein
MQENTNKKMQEKKFELPTIGEIKNKLETALPLTPITGKRLMLVGGSVGFAIAFSSIVFGQQILVFGFVVMCCAAVGYRLIAESEKKNQ